MTHKIVMFGWASRAGGDNWRTFHRVLALTGLGSEQPGCRLDLVGCVTCRTYSAPESGFQNSS